MYLMTGNELLGMLEQGLMTWDDVAAKLKSDPDVPFWVHDVLDSTRDKDPCDRANWLATLADLADGHCRGMGYSHPDKS